jgi:hypothetical protein
VNAFIGDNDRIWYIADAVCMGTATDEDLRELEARVLTDDTARSLYLAYCQLDATLELELSGQRAGMLACEKIQDEMQAATANDFPVAAPTFPFLSSAIHGSICYFSREVPFSFLIAMILTGLLLVGLWLTPLTRSVIQTVVSSSQQSSDNSKTPNTEPEIPETATEKALSGGNEVPPNPVFVARITGSENCQWLEEATALTTGRIALHDKLSLKSGLLELEYDTGARVILQGPCSFTIDSATGGFLKVGKLTAKMEKKVVSSQLSVARKTNPQPPVSSLQPPAPVFAVRTPNAIITDLGTEFGVEVFKSGMTRSHVFQGKIMFAAARNGGARIGRGEMLGPGESVQAEVIYTDSKNENTSKIVVRHIKVPDGTFVRADQMSLHDRKFAAMQKEQAQSAYKRWHDYSMKLRKDPTLVAYYTFEKHNLGNAVLPNQSPSGKEMDGQVVSASWTDGRLPGKMALYFGGCNSNDRVELPHPEQFNFTGPFSVAVWFKAKLEPRTWQSFITKGSFSWVLHFFDDIRFDTGFSMDAKEAERTFHTLYLRVPVSHDRYHLLVATWEPQGDHACKRMYIDGRLAVEKSGVPLLKANNDPVWIGNNSYAPDHSLPGWIDEAAIFSRLITQEEITAMYEAGMP